MPYESYAETAGVLQSEPLEPSEMSGPLGSLLDWTAGVRTVAVKCDLCYFRDDGPKCIEVCPTKALRLVDNELLNASIKAKRRQTVAMTSQIFATPAATENK